MKPWLLFFSHWPQLEWYGLLARELNARLGLDTELWVIGRRDKKRAESLGCFSRVLDLLEGFDTQHSTRDYQQNLRLLADIETTYGGPFFYQDVAIDRHLQDRGWKDTEIVAWAAHLWRRMEEKLAAAGQLPLAAFGENNTLPYRLAHHRLRPRVTYWNFSVVRHWDHRFFLDMDQAEQWPECRRLYQLYRQQGVPGEVRAVAERRLEELQNRPTPPFYMVRATRGGDPITARLAPQRSARSIREWLGELRERESVSNPQAQPPGKISPAGKLARALGETRRQRHFDRIAKSGLPSGQQYACYFLHVQPEYSVEGLAFEFRNQLALLENIASVLPADWRLVVKEHRPMVGVRDSAFYDTLRQIPNLVLLSDQADGNSVFRSSRLILTLTGTVALEAICCGIPAVVFGDVYFDGFEGVRKVKSVPELKAVLGSLLAGTLRGADDQAAVAALAAMYAASHPGKIGGAYTMDEMREGENLGRLANVVERELARLVSLELTTPSP